MDVPVTPSLKDEVGSAPALETIVSEEYSASLDGGSNSRQARLQAYMPHYEVGIPTEALEARRERVQGVLDIFANLELATWGSATGGRASHLD